MKLFTAFLLIFSPVLLIAQKQKAYEPIDSVGWELPDLFALLEHQELDRSELGSVTYILSLDKSGRIKKVKTLSSTLQTRTELKLRNQLEGLTLAKNKSWSGQVGYKGIFEISLSACMDNRDNKD